MPSKTTILPILLLLIIGCAVTPYEQGRELIKDGQYEAALQKLELILRESPDSAPVLREIGIAHYKKGDIPQAIDYLTRAFETAPSDGAAILYLGLAHEISQDYDAAIQTYRNYTQVGRLSGMRKRIEARLYHLINQRMTQLAQEALTAEADGNYPETQPNTIAVMYFDNTAGDEQLEPLRRGLTDLLIADLSKVKALQPVERARLQTLLNEMGLADTGIVDAAEVPRTGRLLGAARVVKGSFTSLPNESLLMNANFSDVATAETQATDPLQGALQELFDMEKALVFSLLDEMGISISPEEEEAIQERPTENLLAFLAYSRGLSALDQGDFEAAGNAFQEAVEQDAGFSQAQQNLETVREISAAPTLTTGAPTAASVEIEAVAAAEVQATEFVTVEASLEAAALAQLDANVGKDFIQSPEGTAGSTTQTRGGGTDEPTPEPPPGRPLSITIIWAP